MALIFGKEKKNHLNLLSIAINSHQIKKSIRIPEDGSDHDCNKILSTIEQTTWRISFKLDPNDRHEFYLNI